MRILSLAALAFVLPVAAQVGNLQISASAVNFASIAGNSTPQTQVIGASSTGAPLPVNLSVRYLTATEGWLTATADSSVTPANITISANAATLAAGNYIGQVLVVATPSQSALVTVSFAVSTSGGGGSSLTASPSSVTLTSNNGLSAQAAVNIGSVGSVPFQIFTNTTSGGNWLTVNTITGTAPTSFTITANPTGLLAGVYSGTVSVAPINGSAGVAIPITFNVSTGTGGGQGFTVSPTSVGFLYQIGSSTPPSQSVFVSNSSGFINYTATSSASWLRLSTNIVTSPSTSVTGSSNANLTFYVDPTSLTAGTYGSLVTLTATNGSQQSVSVSLTVSTSTLLTSSPSSLSFNYQPSVGVPVAQQLTIQSTGGDVSFSASASSTGWLLVGPQFGSTGGSNILTVSVAPTGLPAGTYTGAITVVTGTTTLSVPVSLTVGVGGSSSITANPTSLAFSAPLNGASASQTLLLSSVTTKNFLVSASASGGNWLQVTPNSGTTPASLNVSVNPLAVSTVGVFSGLVQVSNLSDGTQLTVPVTLTITGTALVATPSALSFNLTAGSTSSSSQNVQLSGNSNTVYSVTTDSAWLSASPTSGVVPTTLTIIANPANLTAGNYTGIVTISGGGSTTSVTVSASVSGTASPILNPTSLSFLYATGSAVPAAQTINVSSTLGTLNFSTSARTSSGNNWLIASANSISTPATITVSVQPGGLTPGTYRGVVTVVASLTGESRSTEVTLTVTGPAAPSLRTAVHGATREVSALTPGMILSVMGNNLGPSPGVRGNIAGSGAFETFYNGYRVLFDGVPAPILYISSTQIDTIVPYSLAGRATVNLVVDNAGVQSTPMNLYFSPDAAPGLFTLDSTGRGQAAALNQNGSINGPSNPAASGSVLVLYATGEGQTEPMGQEGRVIGSDLRKPVLPVAVNIGGVPVEVLYAGSAPGQVAGLMQVNVRLNAAVPRGSAVAVELRVGPAPSPAGVTVAIQ